MTYGFLLPLICDLKVNRFDLPFTTLTGLVHCGRYHDNWIHFPAHWRDANFSGVLPKGTPVAQCMPVSQNIGPLRRRRKRLHQHRASLATAVAFEMKETELNSQFDGVGRKR